MVGALSHWDKGREKPPRALELHQYLGIHPGGVSREGDSFQPLQRLRKTNWNAMHCALPFGELRICL